MGITAAELAVRVSAEDHELTSGLRHAEGEVSRRTGGMGAKFAGFGKHVLAVGAALGAGAIAPVALVAKEGFDKLMAMQNVMAQTTNVIRSTGGAAKVSASQIKAMSDTLEKHSMIEAEDIQNGANLMLTFTGVRNEAGKNNDIFNQSITAATNLSTALGQDMQSSVIQLGKALNDPIRGVTALRRVGVSFTADQQKQIKALVASGHTMEAQKLILGELKTEFGGAADAASKTFAGAMFQAKQAVQQASAEMVGSLLPVAQTALPQLTTAFTGLIKDLTPALGSLVGGLGQVIGAIVPILAPVGVVLGQVIGEAAKALVPILQGLQGPIMVVVQAFQSVIPAIQPLLAIFGDVIQVLGVHFANIIAVIGSALKALTPAFQVIAKVMDSLVPIITDVLNSGAELATSVLVPLATLFGKLVAAVAPVIGKFVAGLLPVLLRLTDVVGNVLLRVLRALMPIFDVLTQVLMQVLAAIMPLVPVIGNALAQALQAIAPLLVLAAQLVASLLKAIGPLLPTIIQIAAQFIATLAPAFVTLIQAATPLLEMLLRLVNMVLPPLVVALRVLLGGALKYVAVVIGGVLKVVVGFANWLSHVFIGAIKWVGNAWTGIWNGMVRVAGSIVGVVAGIARTVIDIMLNMVIGILSAMSHLPLVGGMFAKARDKVKGFKKDIDGTLSSIANDASKWGKNTANNFASGILTGKNAVADAAAAVALETQHKLRTSSPAESGPLSTMGGPGGWGENLVASFAKGMNANADLVAQAANALAPSMPASRFATPFALPSQAQGVGALAAAAASQISGTGPTTVNVTVQGQVVTQDRLVDAIHEGLLRKQRRTPLGLKQS